MRDQQLSLLEVRNRMRNQVDDALRLLDEGAHGLCEDCGRPIAPERLKVVPLARRCVECERNAEVIEQIEKERLGRKYETSLFMDSPSPCALSCT